MPDTFPKLALYPYLKGATTPVYDHYGLVEDLQFSTIAPGGFGDLKVHLKVPESRIQQPEYQMFANVALMEGPYAAFLGRWDEPAFLLDQNDGSVWELTAMGPSTSLQDDPEDWSYTSQTALQIITDQMTHGSPIYRNNTIQLDPDQTQILTTIGTWTEAFNGQTFEEVLSTMIPLQGDYTWGVWDHPVNRDAAGFPTWQLFVHARAPNATPSYTGLLVGEYQHEIRPSIEWSYNACRLDYSDYTTLLPASVTVQDSRLTATRGQGTAPFPWRLLKKDASSTSMTSTQATTIANALVGLYQNGGFKVTVELNEVYDGNMTPIPLWRVRADSVIYLPELSITGATLPSTYAGNVNTFYITETQYEEQKSTTPKLTITCNTFNDRNDFWIARLQYLTDHPKRHRGKKGIVQRTGAPEKGTCGTSWGANALSTDVFEQGVNFKTSMGAIPTSITLTATATSNAGTPSSTNISQTGFTLQVSPAAGGKGYYRASYTTVGN